MIKKLKKVLHKAPANAEKKEEACACGCGCNCGKKKAGVLVAALVVAGLVGFVGGRMGCGCCEKKLNDYIQKNPKVIIDSVEAYYKALEAKQRGGRAEKAQEVAPAEIVKEIVNDKSNYSLGNPNGKYVIIEFFDHQCGWCKKTNKEMREAIAKGAKNIRWIPIDTPIFGEKSETIARYVLAAGEQGKYAQMHEAVGNAQGQLDEAALVKLGEGLKLNTKKLTADANGEKIRGKLAANRKYAEKLNINGVPMLIVDGKINPGALLGENLEKAVKASNAK